VSVRKSNCGPNLHILFPVWAGLWKLPERLHHADSGRHFHNFAGLPLPELRDAHQAVRQRAGVCVAVVARQVPGVRRGDFPDVSIDRIEHGFALRGSVS